MNKGIILCVILTLFLAGTSMQPSVIQRARSETNTNPSLNNNSLVSSYDNVTSHEGDLVINGGQTYAIENCSYLQIGNVQVSSYGTLIIMNSVLRHRNLLNTTKH